MRSIPLLRLQRLILPAALAASCLVFVLGAVARLSGFEVWDDGLMFARYAENLAQEGQVAWNPAGFGGEPTWGLTSLGHLAVVSTVRWALGPFGGDALSWAVVSSWLMGWVFLVLILYAARRRDDRTRIGLVAWTAVCLAVGFVSVGRHFGTGMDTMTALVWLTLVLVLAREVERPKEASSSAGVTGGLAVVAGLTFFVRPDAMLFPAAVLAALLIFGPDRRRALMAAAGAAAVLGVVWLATRAAFGTWLPLPFYAKSDAGSHYGAAFSAHYEGVAAAELGLFAVAFWLPILAVGLDIALSPRRWWRESPAVDRGLLAAVIVFAGFHLTQVAPIMGGGQRFYQPLLPALLWLSWSSLPRLRERFVGASDGPSPRQTQLLVTAALVVAICLGLSVEEEARRLRTALSSDSWPALSLQAAYEQRASRYWPVLDAVSGLPPSTLIAATEVGLPGAMNPSKVIVDLAGLHDPDFALRDFSADRVFEYRDGASRRPDVLYLPHPHYESMLRELTQHPIFREEYRVWSAAELDSVLGVAVLRGSLAEEALSDELDAMARASREAATGARSRR